MNLEELVDRIENNITYLDSFGRWDGDEFILACPETDCKGA